MKTSANILIVGHGLVGACLAARFSELGAEVSVVDRDAQDSASRVAAGLMTPVTGKGMNPSKRIEDFYDEALAFFGSFYTETGIVRYFANEAQREKFARKADRDDIRRWITGEVSAQPNDAVYLNECGGFEMCGGWVNTAAFLEASRARLEADGRFQVAEFGPSELTEAEAEFDYIFLSRGAFEFMEQDATFLSQVSTGTHRSAKGEILTVRIPDLNESRILNRNGWLMPFDREKQLYRAGATFEWDELDVSPTAAGREAIENKLQSLVRCSYEIVDHQAGIRPIVRNSHPFVESVGDKISVVNGFGSKGSLYAPRAARELAESLLMNQPLDRWYSLGFGLTPRR